MSSYKTIYVSDQKLSEVARYVESKLSGVTEDRIVSISHSMAVDNGWTHYSAMIVLKRAA